MGATRTLSSDLRSLSPDLNMRRSKSMKKSERKMSKDSISGPSRHSTNDLALFDNDGNAISKT